MRECALVHRPDAFARTVAACFAAAILFAGVAEAEAAPVIVHISPDGSDDNPGTAERPIRTLKKLEKRITQPDLREVVFHAGVYRGAIEIRNSSVADPKDPPPLTLRGDEGAIVVIDGAHPLTGGDPVPDWPGVYLIREAHALVGEGGHKQGYLPAMWDGPARRRYRLAGGLRALRQFPGTYWLTPEGLYVHTVDGKPLEAQRLEISRMDLLPHGVYVLRANVTVKNITVRNFWLNGQVSSGICTASTGKWFTVHNVTIDNCRVQNCPRGVRIRASDSRVTGCRVDDCGTGVYVKAPRVIVEKCRLFKVRDDFMVPMYPQEDTGIEVYYGAGEREDVRFNLCKGFGCGIFIKCSPGDFVVENNTIVHCETGLGFTSSDPGRNYHVRRNVVYGSRRAFWEPGEGNAKFTAESNLIWPGPGGLTASSQKELARLNQLGKDNVLADPRLAGVNAGKFGLLPGSPCLPKAADEPSLGAFGLVDGASTAGRKIGSLPTARVSVLSSVCVLPEQAGESDPFRFLRWNVLRLRIGASTHNDVVAQMRYRLDDGAWSEPEPFRSEVELTLATRAEPCRIGVAVSDDRGRWSNPTSVRLLVSSEKPRVVGTPVVRANAHGAAITFRTNVPCRASGTFGADGREMTAGGALSANDSGGLRMRHSLGFVLDKPAEGSKVPYVAQLEDADGAKHPGAAGSVVLRGANHIWTVDPDRGADIEDGGTEQRPWRTVQYAADRALPGDRVLLKPGLYSRPAVIARGGAAGAALTIAAEQKLQAVFDMRFQAERVIHLFRAPYVELDGLEMRFYGTPDRPRGQALFIVESPGVVVRNCKIWNAYWQGPWPEGIAAEVVRSPRFVAERNLIFRNADGIRLWSSPDSRLVYNTCVGQTNAAMKLVESAAGTVLRNNDLAFNGNDILAITVHKMEEMAAFESDYNNLGTRLRYWRNEPGVVPNVKPREPMLDGSKAVVIFSRRGGTWVGDSNTDSTWVSDKTTPADKRGRSYFRLRTFEDWQIFSGKDKHSIFADPLHHSLVDFVFELDPESPNIGAGENGITIGAMGVWKGAPGK